MIPEPANGKFYTATEDIELNTCTLSKTKYEKTSGYFLYILENLDEWCKDRIWLFQPTSTDREIVAELGWEFISNEVNGLEKINTRMVVSREEFLKKAKESVEKRDLDWNKVKSHITWINTS